jgi:hypothetical protein
MYVDYHGLNKITIKNQYSLPLISELLDQFGQAKIYTKTTFEELINWLALKEVMNGRPCFGQGMDILNIMLCLLVLPMYLLFSNTCDLINDIF